MKNQTLRALLLTAAMTLMAAMTHAQSIERYRAQIPFDFSMGKKHYTAGEYFVDVRGFESKSLVIRDANGRNSYMVGTSPSEGAGDGRTARLDFLKYGDRYILRTVKIRNLESNHPSLSAEVLLAQSDTVSIARAKGR